MSARPFGAGLLALVRGGVRAGLSDAAIAQDVYDTFGPRDPHYVSQLISDERRDLRAWNVLAGAANRGLVGNVPGMLGFSTVNPDGSPVTTMRVTVTLYFGQEGPGQEAFDLGIDIRASGQIRAIFSDAVAEAIDLSARIFNKYPELEERFGTQPTGWYFTNIRQA